MAGLLKKSIILFVILSLFPCAALYGQQTVPDKKFKSWLADRPLISEIVISGNQYFTVSKIKSHLFAREHNFFRWLQGGSRDRVLRYTASRDTLEIKYIYLREGFLNVSIKESYEVSPTDSSAIVNIEINEGSQFLIGRVTLDINDSLPFRRDIIDKLSNLKGFTPVDPITINRVIFDVKTVYANNGYPYATVESNIDSTNGPSRAELFIGADEGPLVRFGNVEIEQMKFYDALLARREITIASGEIYKRDKILESQKRLYSTNLFNSINLDAENGRTTEVVGPQQADTAPNFQFSAIERKPYFASLQTGASQDSAQDLTWDFTSTWGKRNFLVSRRLELSFRLRYIIFTQWRPLLYRFQARITEPWLLGFRIPLTLSARFDPGVQSQKGDYSVQTWSVGLSSRKEWSETLYAIFQGEYENVNIYGVPSNEAVIIRQQENISIRRKLSATLIRDTRINKFVPRSGSFTTYSAQYIGGFLGGDDSFAKLEFSWSRYQPAAGSIILATRFKSGYVKEIAGATSVPINDRFYLGGANSIRGFSENSIGVRAIDNIYDTVSVSPLVVDTGQVSTNIGSKVYLIFNAEFRFPLVWKFWGSIFTDLGNGWEEISDISPNDLLFSYGGGLQFLSPAGPVRLDYAHHLENGIYPEGDRWHITILYAF